MKNRPEREEDAALDELVAAESRDGERSAAQDGSEDALLAALEELDTVESAAQGDDDPGAGDLNDEELAALDELVEKVQTPTGTTEGTDAADEEMLALEELVEGEKGQGTRSEKLPPDDDFTDEEAAALEELFAFSAPETNADQGDGALDGLTSGGKKTGAGSGSDDGIITLKEVVSLGKASEPSPRPSTKLKQRAQPQRAGTVPKKTAAHVGGISDEEHDDLETLIKGFREEASSGATAAVVTDLQTQIHALQKRVVLLSKMMAKVDGKIEALGEVLRLYHKKTELMNRRIDQIASDIEDE